MEEQKIKSEILDQISKAKEEMKKVSYDEQCDSFEKFIKENNCKVKKEDNNG